MSNELIICANPACRVSENGKCIEGLSIEECPQYGQEPEEQEASDSLPDEIINAGLSLPNGSALSVARAAKLLVQKESRVIAVIGPRDTGKTSLVAGIYDLLQTGAIDGVSFARSQTLHAFELACHDARAASRRDTPHMERTGRGEVLFYHLELSGGCANKGITVLLADRSGEEYREVADDISNASDLLEVKRADAVTFLVDGDRLLDSGLRHNVWNDITIIIQGLTEGGALSNSQRVALVLTKLDSIEESEHGERAKKDFAELYAHLLRTMEGKIGRLEVFEVAASPKLGAYQRGHGIDRLVKFWLEDGDITDQHTPYAQVPQRAFARIKPVAE